MLSITPTPTLGKPKPWSPSSADGGVTRGWCSSHQFSLDIIRTPCKVEPASHTHTHRSCPNVTSIAGRSSMVTLLAVLLACAWLLGLRYPKRRPTFYLEDEMNPKIWGHIPYTTVTLH